MENRLLHKFACGARCEAVLQQMCLNVLTFGHMRIIPTAESCLLQSAGVEMNLFMRRAAPSSVSLSPDCCHSGANEDLPLDNRPPLLLLLGLKPRLILIVLSRSSAQQYGRSFAAGWAPIWRLCVVWASCCIWAVWRRWRFYPLCSSHSPSGWQPDGLWRDASWEKKDSFNTLVEAETRSSGSAARLKALGNKMC